jgi:molybdopterin-guanine dinucleotide biosynthesis protein A
MKRASMHQDIRDNVTGVILVGGQSRRMGRDKAFLQIAGKTLFEQVLAVFKASFDRIVLVGGRAERFAGYGIPVLPDIYPGSALGGLYTGLWHAETEYIFVSSCDLPFPNRELLFYLCSLRDGFDAVVPNPAHGFEPLFAAYEKSCLGPMREFLENGNFCAYAYYPQIRARYVRDAELAHIDRDGRSFLNVNTPEEFERIKTGGSS